MKPTAPLTIGPLAARGGPHDTRAPDPAVRNARTGLHRVLDLLRRAAAHLRQRTRMRQSYASLTALDDHTLRDLGFHRSELASLAAGVAGGGDTTRVRAMRPPPDLREGRILKLVLERTIAP